MKIQGINSMSFEHITRGFRLKAIRQRMVVALSLILMSTIALAGPADGLAKLLGRGENEPLRPEQAFLMTASHEVGGILRLHWQIAAKHYLYREQFKVVVDGVDFLATGKLVLPSGKLKHDAVYGQTEVYYNELTLRAALPPGSKDLTVSYQGCAERGVCYPPETARIKLADLPGAFSTSAAPPLTASQEVGADSAPAPNADRLASLLAQAGLIKIIATFYGLGLLLSVTPCVLPMVPILLGVLAGTQTTRTSRAFGFSLVYVLAMALTYAGVGVLAGLLGANLQIYSQHPAAIIIFSGLFGVLAISMLGGFTLQLPRGLQDRLDALNRRQQGGTVLGVAIMGVLSAILVGPCVAAPLAGALIYIGQTGDAVLGGIALFSLSLGMGTLLLAVGASSGRLIPRTGPWMQLTEIFFGVLLLGVAVWLLQRILPPEIGLAVWGAWAVTAGLLLGALRSPGSDCVPVAGLQQALGLLTLVYGLILLVAAASGGDRLWPPLAHLVGANSSEPKQSLAFRRIKSVADLQAQLTQASQNNQPVMLDFYADWCVECLIMERTLFADTQVKQQLAGTVTLQADVTANDATDRELMRFLGVIGPPTVLFFDRQGQERRDYRIVGALNLREFTAHLSAVLPSKENRGEDKDE